MRACTPTKTRKQRTKTPLPLVHPTCKVLTRSPLLHACLQHMLHNYDACNSAATTARRVKPDSSESTPPRFSISLHLPTQRRHDARLTCAQTRTQLRKPSDYPCSHCNVTERHKRHRRCTCQHPILCPISQATTPSHTTHLPTSPASPRPSKSDTPQHQSQTTCPTADPQPTRRAAPMPSATPLRIFCTLRHHLFFSLTIIFIRLT